jgi:hypothetical protein
MADRQCLSIHGRDEKGNLGKGVYNPNPQPPKEPTTERGRRRRANKGKK